MKLFKPHFWKYISWQSIMLLPFAFTYWIITTIRYLLSHPKSVGIPVICIGNIIVGGGGKTPIAIAIAEHLLSKGRKVALLSRGYGGTLSNNKYSLEVDLNLHRSYEVGDEAMILATIAPTYIGGNRYFSALMAEKNGAEIIIMDDGMQNFSLAKNLTIIAADSDYGVGNGLLLPSGPLRQTIASAEKQAQYIIYNGSHNKLFTSSIKYEMAQSVIKNLEQIKSFSKCFVMCGLANPQKLLQSLKDQGIEFLDAFIFPDHHQYHDQELEEIIKISTINKAKILTTMKDYVKIPSQYVKHFIVIDLQLKIENLDTILYYF